MSDQPNTTTTTAQTLTRIFKIGATRIMEDASMAGKTPQEVQKMLTALYPQVENATLRETPDSENGTLQIEFIPRPGRKG